MPRLGKGTATVLKIGLGFTLMHLFAPRVMDGYTPGENLTMSWLKKPLPAALAVVLLWTACRLLFLLHSGLPQPGVHDEFSYLLGADTFAHGRLANPPLELSKFFDSPHNLQNPTYASKYPPGQSMFLALGQVLFGSPFYGVLIGNALMLFSICLMLYAWVPPRWALAMSFMFALAMNPAMYWTTTYWGGSVAASGGALVLLAVGIYRQRQTPLAGALFSAGALLLFWTRPYEGGLFTLAVLIVFFKELWPRLKRGAVVAAVSLFALGVGWTCYDNKAITGHAFEFPHDLYMRQYQVQPVFWFQPLRPQPPYSHPRLAGLHGTYGEEAGVYRELGQRWQSIFIGLMRSLRIIGLTFGLAVLLTLLVPVAWRDPLYRKMTIVSGCFLLGLTAETFHLQHYCAPVWAALGLMTAVWAERAWTLRMGNWRVGRALVVLALVSPALITPLPHLLRSFHLDGAPATDTLKVPASDKWSTRRMDLIHQLAHLDREQLVIVRYPWPDWRVDEEWVYNGADIDHQRVVFAHDFGPVENRALLNHYPDRSVVLVTFDPYTGKEKVEPYSEAADKQ